MHTQCWQMRLVVSLLVVVSGLLGLPRHSPAHVVEFTCAAGDVACLIDAINQANANGQENTITLEAGTYPLTMVNNNTDGPNGLPSVTGVLTIRGAGADITIIQRDVDPPFSGPSFRLIHVAAGGSLTLEGLTLRGGAADPRPGVGGILNRGTLTLTRATLADNDVAGAGPVGGISSSGALTIVNSIVRGNSAESNGGIVSSGSLTILNSTIAGNSAFAGSGGISSSGTLTLANSAIIGNRVAAGGVGGLFNRGTAAVINTTFAGNNADVGGILNAPGVTGTTGVIILTNATLADNRSSPSMAGGIENSGTGGVVVLLNTVLARNLGGPECSGPVTSLGTNLVEDPTGCTITLLPTDLTGDPGLGELTDDGTPGNGHFPLVKGSQAIDAGNDAVCPRTDQLGRRRVGPCDIGAIEFRGDHYPQH